MKATPVEDESGEDGLLFGDEAAADFASMVYGTKVTPDQITYWRAHGIITRRKLGKSPKSRNIYEKAIMRRELRGRVAS